MHLCTAQGNDSFPTKEDKSHCMQRAADALLSLLPGSERAFFNHTCSAMQGVPDPRTAGASDVQTPPRTILGSRSQQEPSPAADAEDVLYCRRCKAWLHCCNPSDLHRNQRELSLKAPSEKADQWLQHRRGLVLLPCQNDSRVSQTAAERNISLTNALNPKHPILSC